MINLAVMSDLHIGLAARGKDLCPEPPTTETELRKKYDAKIDDAYRDKFIEFIEQEQIVADYLVLPGDITNSAHPREVALASDFILQVADSLHVPHEKIVFVPGNHDVDWSAFDVSDDTGVRWGQRYDPIGHDNFHFKRLVDNGDGNVFSSPHFIAWQFDDLFVVGYNSASHDAPITQDAAHHGLADPKHLDELRGFLSKNEVSDEKIRVFLVHHHLINFPNPVATTPDFSLMTNAVNLLALLHEHRFDLLIHGHTHQPQFETHSTQTYPHLPILCSGSFSAIIDTRWSGTIDNQFHLITIDEREGSENYIKGQVTSWANNHARGWKPSEELSTGIHHIIPFGSYVMPGELDARLEPFIQEWLERSRHILWSEVVDAFPEYEYLPLNSAIATFNRVAQQLGRKVMHETRKDLILY